MGVGVVDIWNMALGHLKQGAVTSENDTTRQAKVLRSYYETTRQAELERNRWRFAKAYAYVGKSAAVPEHSWSICHDFPPDCLAIRDIKELDGEDDYDLVGNRIYSNYDGALSLTFTVDVVKTVRFTALFTQSLSLRLAMMIAGDLGADSTKTMNRLSGLYTESIDTAERLSAVERPREQTWNGSPFPEVLD